MARARLLRALPPGLLPRSASRILVGYQRSPSSTRVDLRAARGDPVRHDARRRGRHERIASSLPGSRSRPRRGRHSCRRARSPGCRGDGLPHGELLLLEVDDEDRVGRRFIRRRRRGSPRASRARPPSRCAPSTAAARAGPPSPAGAGRGGAAMRSEIVRQFVSRPPSQRWFTYGMPTRSCAPRPRSAPASWCRRRGSSRRARRCCATNSCASSSSSFVCVRSMR